MAVVKWTLTRHLLGEYAASLDERCGFENATDITDDQYKASGMSRDDKNVEKNEIKHQR